MRGINVTLPISLFGRHRRPHPSDRRRRRRKKYEVHCHSHCRYADGCGRTPSSLSPALPPSNQIVRNVIIGFASFSYIGLARSLPLRILRPHRAHAERGAFSITPSLTFFPRFRPRGPLMRQIGRRRAVQILLYLIREAVKFVWKSCVVRPRVRDRPSGDPTSFVIQMQK